jgi:hypothetical protein
MHNSVGVAASAALKIDDAIPLKVAPFLEVRLLAIEAFSPSSLESAQSMLPRILSSSSHEVGPSGLRRSWESSAAAIAPTLAEKISQIMRQSVFFDDFEQLYRDSTGLIIGGA